MTAGQVVRNLLHYTAFALFLPLAVVSVRLRSPSKINKINQAKATPAAAAVAEFATRSRIIENGSNSDRVSRYNEKNPHKGITSRRTKFSPHPPDFCLMKQVAIDIYGMRATGGHSRTNNHGQKHTARRQYKS